MFYVSTSIKETPLLHVTSAPQGPKEKKNERKIVMLRQEIKPSAAELIPRLVHQAPLEMEVSFENPWQEELFYLLKQLEPERGELMFHAYVEEMRSHEEKMKSNLNLALNGLSALNGESGHEKKDEGRAPASAKDPVKLELQHQEKLKSILGEHYDLVLEQEKLFQDDRSVEVSL